MCQRLKHFISVCSLFPLRHFFHFLVCGRRILNLNTIINHSMYNTISKSISNSFNHFDFYPGFGFCAARLFHCSLLCKLWEILQTKLDRAQWKKGSYLFTASQKAFWHESKRTSHNEIKFSGAIGTCAFCWSLGNRRFG